MHVVKNENNCVAKTRNTNKKQSMLFLVSVDAKILD